MSVEQTSDYLHTVYGVDPSTLEARNNGGFNQVLIDRVGGLAFRFLRYPGADHIWGEASAGMARFGAEVLAYLEEKAGRPPLPIPSHRDVIYDSDYDRPLCVVSTYMSGKPLSEMFDTAGVQSLDLLVRERFSPAELARFGGKVADCVYWLAQTIPAKSAAWLGADEQSPAPHLASLDFDHLSRLQYGVKPGNQAIVVQCPQVWSARQELLATPPTDITTSKTFGHYDLRPENFLFDKNQNGEWEACAWLDFDLGRQSTPACELRHLARLGPAALEAGVARYKELSGGTVEPDDVLAYARIHNIATVLISIDLRRPKGLTNAKQNLDILWPDRDWSELDQLAAQWSKETPAP